MGDIDILKDLFDQKIIRILNVFLENQERHFSLSEISSLSKVHVTTTFRIINKLIEKDFLKIVVVGKSKFYRLKSGDKSLTLFRFLRKEGDYLSDFIDGLKENARIKKIVLESKSTHGAKLILVGEFIPMEKIQLKAREIKTKHNYKINLIEISEKQYDSMKKMNFYDIDKKVVWERKS